MSSITPPKDGFNCLGDRNGYNRGRCCQSAYGKLRAGTMFQCIYCLTYAIQPSPPPSWRKRR
ncbi:uncharacterized protein EHS24_003936 [Apiotrichum porosum]|uniref:Uncharacterized protein n=1 Tax=Apiotrichum porosum TaxID=105984 RepID=A0A427XDR4_9TREE|nr:uncharacterized protein EHS24_003936 [Apiotrichum porosum]RSH76995.1 hypothetical protein EHS24_003936 [Apiotrichum porosum]